MNDDELVQLQDSSNNMSVIRPPAYDLLLRQSRKLGTVATNAFSDLRERLHNEIVHPPTDRFLNSVAEYARRGITAEREEIAVLKEKVRKSHQLLASVRTVFPITLFPDSFVMDRSKITIIKRNFFWSANIVSIQIEDILNVSNSVGPFFGSLTIASRVMSTVDHFQINYLWRNDAIFLKHIIQGYVIAKNSQINTDALSRRELVRTLREIGLDSDS